MAAFAQPEGKSMMDKVAESGQMDLIPIAFGFDEDLTRVPNYPKEGLMGQANANELNAKEVEDYIGSLVRWNGRCMYSPIQNTPAWRDKVRISYIYTTGDATVPADYQKNIVELLEKEGKTVETVELETGHCPNLTATHKVVDAVIKFTSH
jgi:pimeloyl-ACP methyl ester carboxylesterase